MDRHDQLTQRALDNDTGDSSFIDTRIEVVADLVVFNQFRAEVPFLAIPHRVPSADDAQPVTYRITFLTHYYYY
jgi:hypothetical protein